jgi:4-carboxymuconolactone decarboxylase
MVICAQVGSKRTEDHKEEALMNRYLLRIGCLALAAMLGFGAASFVNSQTGDKAKRFPQLTLDQLNEQQRPLGEKIMKISSVGIGGPYNPLLRSPVLAQRMYDLLDYLRWNSSLSRKLTEFAILIVARQWRSQIEWYAHYPLALKEGLPKQAADDIKANKRPHAMTPDVEAVYDFCTELSTKHEVSDATFGRARQYLSDQQIVDLTTLSGTYVTLAMVLSMAQEGVPPGKEPPFKPGEP